MIDFSRKTRQAGEGQSSAFRNFLTQIQPYQNIIFFILLIISLAILLFIWRSYRVRGLSREAWEKINITGSVQNLRNMEQKFRATEVWPFILYRLCSAYYREEQYQAAKKECKRFLKSYPEHSFRAKVEKLLKDSEVNIKWQTEGKQKELNKLKVLRDSPLATVKTKHGEFEIELYEDDAPNTVANFITLAEQDAYNHTPFYEKTRLGLCLGTKENNPPVYLLPFETNSLRNVKGSIGTIRDLDPKGKPERAVFLNSASSRFYISLDNNPAIDGKYTIFGRVTKGLEVVLNFKKGNEITEVVIKNKRDHPYKPKVIQMK